MTRATMLAQDFGWVGFAADIYGDVSGLENRTIRREQTTLYRGNNTLFYSRIQAAVDAAKAHPDVLPDKIAVIGCKLVFVLYKLLWKRILMLV